MFECHKSNSMNLTLHWDFAHHDFDRLKFVPNIIEKSKLHKNMYNLKPTMEFRLFPPEYHEQLADIYKQAE